MSEFNHHVYLISYADSLDGPIKIGYSHHPPTRLKQLQTGSSRQLSIYGNLALKDEFATRAVEKIILSYLIDNNVNALLLAFLKSLLLLVFFFTISLNYFLKKNLALFFL